MMKKTVNLFVKMHFTSLSPDAQLISMAIVSEDMKPCDFPDEYPKGALVSFSDYKKNSFYAEFSDFSIDRCDDWVKENVVEKLYFVKKHGDNHSAHRFGSTWECRESFEGMKLYLWEYLEQFKDYDIQFVCDCGWFNWYWMLQLIGEWEEVENEEGFSGSCPTCGISGIEKYKIGLPKLPFNISPVPQDLNDLIARVKGISTREAFDLNREELAFGHHSEGLAKRLNGLDMDTANELATDPVGGNKHNALWDAKVIKAIYNKIK